MRKLESAASAKAPRAPLDQGNKRVVIVFSVIGVPETPLSYSTTRSVFSHEQRFAQTLRTLNSIRMWDPSAKIIILELSPFVWPDTDHNIVYLAQESTLVSESVFSPFKGLGQAVAFCQLFASYPIQAGELWWVSGRYSILSNGSPRQIALANCVIANHSGMNKNRRILTTTFVGFRGEAVQAELAGFLWSSRWRLLLGKSIESVVSDFAEAYEVVPRQDRIVGQVAVSGDWVNQ
jgi:hypothetical protein